MDAYSEEQQNIAFLKEEKLKIKMKLEDGEEEMDQNGMDVLDDFDGASEEFIKEDTKERNLGVSYGELELKEEQIDQSEIALNNVFVVGDGKLAEEGIIEKTEYLDEVENEISASTSDEEHIPKPKKFEGSFEPKPFECEVCGRTFAKKPHVTRHMRTHTGERPYKCSYCPANFPEASTVAKHHRIHTNERPFVCNICGKSFIANVLKKHKREVHNIIDTGEKTDEKINAKTFECGTCGLSFAQKATLQRHMRTHTGERPYKCSYCPATFADTGTVHKHHRTHTNERPYVCNICGKSFATNVLKKHIRAVHSLTDTGEKPKPHECEVCGRPFAQKKTLKRHMRTHTGERPYKCSYCPAAFADADTVIKHHRTHTNERPYVCDICGKSFASNLKRHKREAHSMIYTGEKPHRDTKPKPFACEICDRTFALNKHVTRHMRTHTGERPYKCSYCPKAFADADTVNKHHRTHTNERPYVCDVCGKSFTTNILKKHKMEAHGIIPIREETTKPKSYDCKICERTYGRKHHLTRHMRIHAGFEDVSTPHVQHRTSVKELLNTCTVCGKSFAHKKDLKLHELNHTDEKQHESVKFEPHDSE